MKNTSNPEETIDRLLEILLNEGQQKIETLVTHKYPDDDALLCLWIAKNFIPNTREAKIIFVNAGTIIPGTEDDPSVLYFDTGFGQYDNHAKGLKRSCSAKLLVEKLNLPKDNGLKPLIDLAVSADNIDPMPIRDIHYIIAGYPQKFRASGNGEIDWEKVQERVFELFDIVYGQEKGRNESRIRFQKIGRTTKLPNGIKVASILNNPSCRETAFEEGAAVVIWTQHKGKGFYTGIAVNRKYPILLDNVVANLRFQENKIRSIDGSEENLRCAGKRNEDDPWFLYDNKKLILNGSRSFTPNEEQFTKLVPDTIIGAVHRSLSAIPRDVVSGWNR